VFPPNEMLEVKRQLKEWEAKLKIQGWKLETFSMAEAIHEIFQTNDFRDVWLASETDKLRCSPLSRQVSGLFRW
jgi:hypothetical protein